MVFWKTYPISAIIKTICHSGKFIDLSFRKESIKSPTGYDAKIVTNNQYSNKSLIRNFLRAYFGNPPSTPILDIPEKDLIKENDIIFYVKDSDKIVGCIRYHYLGNFISDKDQPIYIVDCFCIHPQWRKSGLGDYLLTTLHLYANEHNIPYCLFLKEGPSLSIIHYPIYSGIYVFKKVVLSNSIHVINLSIKKAYKMIDIFREINPDIFIIRNENDNQHWVLYKKEKYIIIACIQYTYQWFIENGQKKKMGWITCWLESPNTNNKIRSEASEEIADFMYGTFDYIWMNREWTGTSTKWTLDGPFHWYAYQWTSSLSLQKNYCILH